MQLTYDFGDYGFLKKWIFSTGALNFEKKLLAPAIFGHFSTVLKKLRVPNKNITYTQEPQYQNRKYATFLYQEHKELYEMILKECKTGKTSSLD